MEKEFKKRLMEVRSRISTIDSVIPAQRTGFKQGYSFSNDTFEAQLPAWHHIWKKSAEFRPMLHAYFFLEQYVNKKELHSLIWQTSLSWQEEVSDWPLCDSLSKINTKVLETYPSEVYVKLSEWNKSDDLWKRRQSVVSLLYYSRTKKTFLPFDKIAALVAHLITDKEYYVQKGVGWTLREMYNVYPAETVDFLRQHIKSISAIAFTIAIEKMSGEEKDSLKALRKKNG